MTKEQDKVEGWEHSYCTCKGHECTIYHIGAFSIAEKQKTCGNFDYEKPVVPKFAKFAIGNKSVEKIKRRSHGREPYDPYKLVKCALCPAEVKRRNLRSHLIMKHDKTQWDLLSIEGPPEHRFDEFIGK